LRRKCSCGEQGSASQGTCAACKEEDEHLRRKATSGARSDSLVPAAVHETLATAGQPLDAQTRGFLEPRFGLDLGDVRVHDDSLADASARSVNALAYTVGEHVVFRRGAFSPESADGKALLAHELAHTVQQGRRRPASADALPISRASDPAE